MEILDSFNLTQWVSVATHIEHSTLDLVIVSSDSLVTHNVSVLPASPFDHFLVFTAVDMPTISPPPPVMHSVRHNKSIHRENFNHDLASVALSRLSLNHPPLLMNFLNATTPL